jgi:triphosphatase
VKHAVSDKIEVELKFIVPATARAAVLAEMARSAATQQRTTLAARYLDTHDRRLAREGIAWRLRREGRRWVQTLKAGGATVLERFEHDVVRPAASHDALLHAGTPVGDRLITLLAQAQAEGVEPVVRFETQVRRLARHVRTRGAVVEIAFDEGLVRAGDKALPIREIEFELKSGSATAMLALVERWRRRFGLVYDPRSKAARGDRLAAGSPFAPLRKAGPPRFSHDAGVLDAFGSVLDECMAQISANAIGLIDGDPALRPEYVHQLRVGIRRLRSATRSFRGWTPAPPDDLVNGLRRLFTTLGRSRDTDVLGSGVVAALAKVGAPSVTVPGDGAGPSPVEAVAAADTQRSLLAWIAWRMELAEQAASITPAAGSETPQAGDEPTPWARLAARRLRRWHRRIVADCKAFDALDDAGLHALRKRVKRQRYAVEFFAPVLRRRDVARYLAAVAAVQDRMGELNDLFVARARYQGLVESEPAAWFALGWLAARIAEVRTLVRSELGRLAKASAPAD